MSVLSAVDNSRYYFEDFVASFLFTTTFKCKLSIEFNIPDRTISVAKSAYKLLNFTMDCSLVFHRTFLELRNSSAFDDSFSKTKIRSNLIS